MTKKTKKMCISYLTVTALTVLFAVIYNHFGHGVRSVFMNLAWMWPAVAFGAALAAFLTKKTVAEPGRVFLACGTATLTVGFILQGIFEIAGTGSKYITVFFTAGAVMMVLSVVSSFLRKKA